MSILESCIAPDPVPSPPCSLFPLPFQDWRCVAGRGWTQEASQRWDLISAARVGAGDLPSWLVRAARTYLCLESFSADPILFVWWQDSVWQVPCKGFDAWGQLVDAFAVLLWCTSPNAHLQSLGDRGFGHDPSQPLVHSPALVGLGDAPIPWLVVHAGMRKFAIPALRTLSVDLCIAWMVAAGALPGQFTW